MKREEFALVVAYLAASCNRAMPTEQANVYYDLLRDLPAEAVGEAARRAVAANQFPNIPPVGTLRALALEVAKPEAMTWGEAWYAVMLAVGHFGAVGPTGHDASREALASLPPAAARAARAMGWRTLCDALDKELGTLRAQFRDIYSPLADREERLAALPPPSRALLAGVGKPVPLAIEGRAS